MDRHEYIADVYEALGLSPIKKEFAHEFGYAPIIWNEHAFEAVSRRWLAEWREVQRPEWMIDEMWEERDKKVNFLSYEEYHRFRLSPKATPNDGSLRPWKRFQEFFRKSKHT